MNGEAPESEHGYTLRVVVPGSAGVRSPKWLSGIRVQDQPSDNHMQQRAHKLLPPNVTEDTVDREKSMTIYDMPLNSAICEPLSRVLPKGGRTILRDYAIAIETAGDVVRVDASVDGGRNWSQAELEHSPHATLDLPECDHELGATGWTGGPMMQIAVLGSGLGRNSCSVVKSDAATYVILKRRVQTAEHLDRYHIDDDLFDAERRETARNERDFL